MMIVNDYIGVDAGNLHHFSHKSLEEFYPHYCGLDIDLSQFPGTKKDKFIAVIKQASKEQQGQILNGLLAYLPLKRFEYTDDLTDEVVVSSKKQDAFEKIQKLIERLGEDGSVIKVNLSITNETVRRAIEDAKILIEKNGGTSGVDRIHTVLHGYLKQICKQSSITIDADDSLTQLFSKLKHQHPALQNLGVRQDEIEKIVKAFSNVLDKLNPIRNKASLSHPNDHLLEEDEAILVINAAHTVLDYLNRKFRL
jgi:hypothetical protein